MESAPAEDGAQNDVCFVRWCGSRSKFDNLLHHIQDGAAFDGEVAEKVAGCLLGLELQEEAHQEVSVYRTLGANHESLGYRTGMFAVAVNSGGFNPDNAFPTKAKNKKRKGATILLFRDALAQQGCSAPCTPQGCLTFSPAMRFHHDLECGGDTAQTATDLARAVWEVVRQEQMACFYVDLKVDGVEPVPFSQIAETVATYAHHEYGRDPEQHWQDLSGPGAKTAEWQVRALERLIDIFELKPDSTSQGAFRATFQAELEYEPA